VEQPDFHGIWEKNPIDFGGKMVYFNTLTSWGG
jgi:hypothetical protein